MPYRSLADFLEELENAGELVRIAAEVDPELELAEIVAQASAGAAAECLPALLFQNVKGCRPAVAVNLLGSEARIRRALGVNSLAEMAERLTESLIGQSPAGWFDRLKWSRPTGGERWQPKVARNGACQQVVRLAGDVDLGTLPALKCWPAEAGRSIRASQVYSTEPGGNCRLVEACDAQILDRTRLALLCDPRQPMARHLEDYRERKERMPIALVLGGDPAYRLAVGSPLTTVLDPLLLSGLFRGQPVELVKCRSHDLGVPADADLVIEGYIDPAGPTAVAGPIGSDSGLYYGLPRKSPVVDVLAVTERTNPICSAIVAAGAADETRAMNDALARIFLPLVQAVVPELVDYSLPGWGGPQKFLFVSIRKSHAYQARRVASAIWGWEPLATAKMLVIVDAEVNVHDPAAVWSRVGANVHPGRDVFFHTGPGDMAEHSIPVPGVGQSLALDATAKLPAEHGAPWPAPLVGEPAIRRLVENRWPEYGLPPRKAAAPL